MARGRAMRRLRAPLLRALSRPLSPEEAADVIGCRPSDVRVVLAGLIRDGLVDADVVVRWHQTEEGAAAADGGQQDLPMLRRVG